MLFKNQQHCITEPIIYSYLSCENAMPNGSDDRRTQSESTTRVISSNEHVMVWPNQFHRYHDD